MTGLRYVPSAVTNFVRLPHRVARGLLLRDFDAWLRFEFLGVVAQTGLAAGLATGPRTAGELCAAFGLTDADLLEALLELGVALGEVRRTGDRFSARGSRLKALADTSGGGDLSGMVQEGTRFSSAIYRDLAGHLRGTPRQDYFADAAEVVAQSSRLAEAMLEPVITSVVRSRRAASLLDIGCGSGIYLELAGRASGDVRLAGIDRATQAVAVAQQRLAAAGLGDRCDVRCADLDDLPVDLAGPHDVVLLLQNIYYWPPLERARIFAKLRALAPTGTAVVASAVPSGLAFGRHLDLVMRVSSDTYRLPTRDELSNGLRDAGFVTVELVEPLPTSGLVAAIAS